MMTRTKSRITVEQFAEKLLSMTADKREQHLRSLHSKLSEQQYTTVFRALSDMSRNRRAAPRPNKAIDTLKDAWGHYCLSPSLLRTILAAQLRPSEVRHMEDAELRNRLPGVGPARLHSLRSIMSLVDRK